MASPGWAELPGFKKEGREESVKDLHSIVWPAGATDKVVAVWLKMTGGQSEGGASKIIQLQNGYNVSFAVSDIKKKNNSFNNFA